MKDIINELFNEIASICQVQNQILLFVVDINIFWRLCNWIIAEQHLVGDQFNLFLPVLGAWHPLKVG